MFFALIDHYRNLRGVPIVFVVLGELKIPFEFAGVGIEGEQRVAIKIVARASFAAIAGRGIAGGPESRVRGGIVRTGDPGGRAADFPGGGFPSLVAWLAGAGNGVEAPFAFPGGGVVRVNEAANAVFAAGYAHDDEIFNGERRERDAVAFAIVKRGGIPNYIAGLGVESDNMRVECAEENFVTENGEAAIDATAAGTNVGRKSALVLPDRPARSGVESEGAIVLAGGVENSVDNERRGFKLAACHRLVSPFGH